MRPGLPRGRGARAGPGDGGTGGTGPAARRLAYTRISKAQVAHPQIIAAFEAVERWMSQQGIEATGPCREVYFADWEAAGPDDAVCDIAFPVRP